MMLVRKMNTLVIVMMSITIHGFILAVAIPVFAAVLVHLHMSALCNRSSFVTSYDLILKNMNVFPTQPEIVTWLYHWGLSNPTIRFVKTTWS